MLGLWSGLGLGSASAPRRVPPHISPISPLYRPYISATSPGEAGPRDRLPSLSARRARPHVGLRRDRRTGHRPSHVQLQPRTRTLTLALAVALALALSLTQTRYDGQPPNAGDAWSLAAALASALFILRLEV